MGVNESLKGLVETIKITPEYSRLKQARSIISKNPVLRKDMEELDTEQKQLYSGRLSSREAEAKLKELNSRLESLSKKPEIEEYLKALKNFNMMISKVYDTISEHLGNSLQ